MNKKIKIAISILITLILISLANTVFAEGELHTDIPDGTTIYPSISTHYSPTGYYPNWGRDGKLNLCGEQGTQNGSSLKFGDGAAYFR